MEPAPPGLPSRRSGRKTGGKPISPNKVRVFFTMCEQPDEADFVETFLKSVWPDRRNEDNLVRLDGWFSVPPAVQLLPCTAPQELVADCLLTAALASPASAMVPRLFARLAEPLLWPRVTPMPSEDCFYRAKCDQVCACMRAIAIALILFYRTLDGRRHICSLLHRFYL